jgi:hypothetical protein
MFAFGAVCQIIRISITVKHHRTLPNRLAAPSRETFVIPSRCLAMDVLELQAIRSIEGTRVPRFSTAGQIVRQNGNGGKHDP